MLSYGHVNDVSAVKFHEISSIIFLRCHLFNENMFKIFNVHRDFQDNMSKYVDNAIPADGLAQSVAPFTNMV